MEESTDFIIIEWVDSCENIGWMSPDSVFDESPGVITSIGFLLKAPSDDYPFYCIVRDRSSHSICGAMEIPVVSVLSAEEFTV